ncbi:Putative AGC protein kinase family protein [Zea mays]|uniref:Putative AGC protein kinase family protein n=1 Tax=Zea mays TaxID=4577 RepID=A0A1D6FN73_MAIZE|nr:Putative AGC protein kinase family protein [Zea mays]
MDVWVYEIWEIVMAHSLALFLTCETYMHADLQRSSSFTRHSAGSPSDTADMDASMEANGTDTHMRTGSAGDPMAP